MGLFFLFVGILILVFSGAALLFMTPRQQALFIALGTGALDLLGGAFLGYLVFMSGDDPPPGVQVDVLRFIAVWCLLEGFANLGLAAGISARVPVCALICAGLHTLGCVVQLATEPKSPVMLFRLILTLIFWRAFFNMSAEQADALETQRRRQEMERLRASGRLALQAPYVAPAASPPSRSSAPAPAPSARLAKPLHFVPSGTAPAGTGEAPKAPSGTLIARRKKAPAAAPEAPPGEPVG